MRRKKLFAAFLACLSVGVVMGPARLVAQESTQRKARSQPQPVYPELARKMNVSGSVKIEVVIDAVGNVKSTRVIGGHPVLVEAALGAMKKWKFESASKETTQVVEFKFARPGE